MATTNLKTTMNIVDMMKTLDPSGKMAEIINPTVETNDFLKDAQWMKANNVTTHQMTRVASLPTASVKTLGEGVPASAGSHAQVVEDTMRLEGWLEVEDQELDNHPNPEAYLRQQIGLYLQSMYQDMGEILLYGNRTTDYKKINGIFTRMNALQSDKKLGKVLSAAVAGDAGSDKTSLLIVNWGEMGAYLLYPGDLPNGGIETKDFGFETKEDSSGLLRVARQRIRVGFGLAIKDLRNVVRIANIDTSTMDADTTKFLTVEEKIMEALDDMPNGGKGAVIYGNTWAKTMFNKRVNSKSNVWHAPADAWGQRVTMFQDTPVRVIERILKTESAIS